MEQLSNLTQGKNGLYYIVNTEDYQGNGYFYVQDNLMIGKSMGNYNPDYVDKSFVKEPSEYPFFDNLFFVSGFIPRDLDPFASIISNFMDYQTLKNIFALSNGVEVNANILSINTNESFSKISDNNYIKLKTEAKIDDIIPLLKEKNIEYKKTSQILLSFI